MRARRVDCLREYYAREHDERLAAIRAKSSDATSIQRLLIMIGGRLRRLDGLRAGAQAESVRETLGL